MNAGPTSTIDSNVKTVQLTGSSGSINFVGCPGIVGVQDLTGSQSTTLTAGGSYSMTVEFGTCGGNYSGAGQVWIDYDQNQLFDAIESIGTWTGVPPAAPVTFNFTVPANAQSGSTRMRVTQQEGGTLPLNPCASFSWGSVMDFGIVITGGIDCSNYHGDVLSDALIIPSVPYSTTINTGYCYYNQNLVYSSPDVYYKLITSAGTKFYHVSLCGSSFDTYLSVIKSDGSVVAYNDDGSCGSASELNFTSTLADTFYIVVEGWGSESGNAMLAINQSSLGIESFETSNVKASPNPSSEMIHFTSQTSVDIVISDMHGRLVESFTVEDKYTLDVTKIQSGIYFARFLENGQPRFIKLQIL
jgi:hypothetical protein